MFKNVQKSLGVAFVLLLMVGCNGASNGKVDPQASRPKIAKEQFDKLVALDDDSLTRKALAGSLGNCQIPKTADTGCGDESKPLFGVKLNNENLFYPEMKSSVVSQYCLSQTGNALRFALSEGFCFAEQVPFTDFTDEGLSRKAYVGELGKCRLDQISTSGCGSAQDEPSYKIKYGNGTNFVLNDSGEPDGYCFEGAGAVLRKLLEAGECVD